MSNLGLLGRCQIQLVEQFVHTQLHFAGVLHVNLARAGAGSRSGVDHVRRHVEALRLDHRPKDEVTGIECLGQRDAGTGVAYHLSHGDAEAAHIPADLATIEDFKAVAAVRGETIRGPAVGRHGYQARRRIHIKVKDGEPRPQGRRRRYDCNRLRPRPAPESPGAARKAYSSLCEPRPRGDWRSSVMAS